MSKRHAVLVILLLAFGLGAVLLNWDSQPAGDRSRILPAKEVPLRTEVAQAKVPEVVREAAAEKKLEDLFAQVDLPATEKAHLLDLAVQENDARLMQKAEDLLRRMVQTGTVADALAAIPKLPYFVHGVANLQESLCRFQEDEFGFEIIKAKFIKVLGNDPTVKPWDSVCGAG